MSFESEPRWIRYLSWLALIVCETCAQLTLKMSALQSMPDLSNAASLAGLITNKWFVTSIICDIGGFFAWMSILRRHDLSVAVPLSSICYVAIIFLAVLVFREPINGVHAIGLVAIALGIYLLTRSSPEDIPCDRKPLAAERI